MAIYFDYTVTVKDGEAKLNKDIYLYQGNRNIDYYFTIKEAPFKYSKPEGENIIEKLSPSHAAVTLLRTSDNVEVGTGKAEVLKDKIKLTIKKEMIDEKVEVGKYTMVIDLMDDENDSIATLPPIVDQIEIRPRVTSLSFDGSNVVNEAVVDCAIITGSSELLNVFDDQGNYIKTIWKTGDKIVSEKLNKIEEAIYQTTEKSKSIPTKTSQLVNDSEFVGKKYVDDINNRNTKYIDSKIQRLVTDSHKFMTILDTHPMNNPTYEFTDSANPGMVKKIFNTDIDTSHITNGHSIELSIANSNGIVERFVLNGPITTIVNNKLAVSFIESITINGITAKYQLKINSGSIYESDGTTLTESTLKTSVLFVTAKSAPTGIVQLLEDCTISIGIFTPNYLSTDNNIEYTPATDYSPATKKYVDEQYNTIEQELGKEVLPTTSQTLKGAIAEVFQSASSGKSAIATAITGKGINASASDTFMVLANKIGQIETGSASVDGLIIMLNGVKYQLSQDSEGNVTATIVKYTVTNNLTNATNSSNMAQIDYGSNYIATITANSGYRLDTVVVKMDNIDITSSVYANGNINIASVTGNIVITVTTVVDTSNNEVGSIDSNKNITLNGLVTGTYTLKYEDENGVISDFDIITTMEV